MSTSRARARSSAAEQTEVHRRLLRAAAKLLPAEHAVPGIRPWWRLPTKYSYLWRFLPHHLDEAGLRDELVSLLCDLRWTEAKTRHLGSAVGVEADLALADTSTTNALAQALRESAHLFGPIEPTAAIGATLASRLFGLPGLEKLVDRYRATLPRPRVEPVWPMPDQPQLARPLPGGGHSGSVTNWAFSPDGALLATYMLAYLPQDDAH